MTAIEVICAYAPHDVWWQVTDKEGTVIKGTLRRISFKKSDPYVKLDLARPYVYFNERGERCTTYDPKVNFDECKPILKPYKRHVEDSWIFEDPEGARKEGWAVGLKPNQYVVKTKR
jgi:hypothetical protein